MIAHNNTYFILDIFQTYVWLYTWFQFYSCEITRIYDPLVTCACAYVFSDQILIDLIFCFLLLCAFRRLSAVSEVER